MSGTLSVGPWERMLLLGGGTLLFRLATWARAEGLDVAVVTSPRHVVEPLPDGRVFGKALADAGVVVHDVATLADAPLEALCDPPDRTFMLSLGAAWIFNRKVLEGPFGDRLFNLHGTRLPQNRGGGTFSWQILMGIRLGFCLLHRVEPGIDTGDVVALREFLYPASCRTPADYMAHYQEENFRFLTSLVGSVRKGPEPTELSTRSQLEYLSTYWPRLHTDTHGWIDWSLPVDELDRFVCAFDSPYGGARTCYRGAPVRVRSVAVDRSDGDFHPMQYGIVYRSNGQWLSVAANGGTLLVGSLSADEGGEGGQGGEDGEAVNLSSVQVGDRLHTPAERLDDRAARIIYTPTGMVSRP